MTILNACETWLIVCEIWPVLYETWLLLSETWPPLCVRQNSFCVRHDSLLEVMTRSAVQTERRSSRGHDAFFRFDLNFSTRRKCVFCKTTRILRLSNFFFSGDWFNLRDVVDISAARRFKPFLRPTCFFFKKSLWFSLFLSHSLSFSLSLSLSILLVLSVSLCPLWHGSRGGGLGSSTIFKKFHETYAPS